jgi:hypothetical protein
MYPHRIRLRGPWDFESLTRADGRPGPLPTRGRMIMPCRWGEGGLGDFAGRVRFRRHFGWPGRLDAHERVWLILAGVEGAAQVRLNGQMVANIEGESGPWEFEVTPLLQVRNELVAELDGSGGLAGLWGEVALEVRCTAFLRNVRWWTVPVGEAVQLHVAGELVGASERPLELYTLVDGKTVIYRTLEPASSGTPFHLTSADLLAEHRHVRIEVVNGACVWHVIEGATELIPK